jgi:hypothetical protein
MPPRAWDHVLSQGSAAGDSPALHRLTVQKRAGGEGTRLWVDDLEGLLAWSRSAPSSCILDSTVDDLEYPEYQGGVKP